MQGGMKSSRAYGGGEESGLGGGNSSIRRLGGMIVISQSRLSVVSVAAV